MVLSQAVVGKALCTDGCTNRFYKAFSEHLLPRMLSFFNSISPTFPFPRQEADITILPKPGKDALDSGSYRPISLLNCDIKLYS